MYFRKCAVGVNGIQVSETIAVYEKRGHCRAVNLDGLSWLFNRFWKLLN